MTREKSDDVLERNVESLLESGGESPRMAPAARARIRAALIAKHGAAERAPRRGRWLALGLGLGVGLAAAALVTLLVLRRGGQRGGVPGQMADGTTWVLAPGARVSVLGPRHVRVEGAALLDVAPGKDVFRVDTRRGQIEVLGTRFLVDATASRTTAAVVRGLVRLRAPEGMAVLHAGEQGVAEPGRAPTRGPAPRLSHLVSWAAQARRESDPLQTPVHHGTLFARDPGVRSHPPWGAEYPLPIKRLGVDIVVDNQVARVALDQTFHNDANEVLEGVYRFAIPPDAALQRLAMYVDGKLVESAVVERMRARRIYEELVYRRVDPALLEWAGTGRLALRVYPLPANQDKRLVLAYTQSLARLYDDWTLSVPLPEIDQPVGEVAFDVTMRGCAACEVTSTSHAITVAARGADAVVTYRGARERIGDSLVLHVRDPKRPSPVVTQQSGDDAYLLVRAPADLEARPVAYRPRTWVILDDVSASRDATSRSAQADFIYGLLHELDEDDRVAVFAFDVKARQKLAPTRVRDVDRGALRAVLRDEGNVGATDFAAALDAATQALAGTPPGDAMVVYLGDGIVTSGARNLDALRAQLAGKARFIGVGIGDGPDTQTLEALAAATGGHAITVDLADDIAWRAFDLVATLHTTRVTGLAARLVDGHGAPVAATLYLRSPQLADGEELELVGKLQSGGKLAGPGAPAAVLLTGTMEGAPWERRIALANPGTTDAGYLPRMWAQRHVTALLLAKHEPVALAPCAVGAPCPTEAEAREARDERIRKEIVALGKRYFLLSRHTSLLVLENDAMYAQYDVTKGSGATWAPYALPATIPVVTSPIAVKPLEVAEDAELVRSALQVFYHYGYLDGVVGETTIVPPQRWGDGFGMNPTTGAREGFDVTLGARIDLAAATDMPNAPLGTNAGGREHADAVVTAAPRQSVTTAEISGVAAPQGGQFRSNFQQSTRGPTAPWGGSGPLLPQRYLHPSDVAFDDLSSLVPALFPDGTDAWRAQLSAGGGQQHSIDAAARTLLTRARAALPTGIYRWGDLELAVDPARRVGWRRSTDFDLAETASFDGITWTRRYPELGLDVTRNLGDDDIAFALANLPVWIAEPAHYARWFDVRATGPHQVTLSRIIAGNRRPAFVLDFDSQHRLLALRDGAGTELVQVTWGALGPSAARVLGGAVRVDFTAQAIADATTWAHTAPAPGVVVELPGRLPAYWQQRIDAELPGSPAWRHAQRQRLVSLAATEDRGGLIAAYTALRAHGGVELGDLVLASGGLATLSASDAELAVVVGSFGSADTLPAPVRYLAAGRAYRANTPTRVEVTGGVIGALWQLRQISAALAANRAADAVEQLVAMGDHAPGVRLVAAAAIGNRWDLEPATVGRAWDAVAVGPYRNMARAQAIQALANRGAIDAAVERAAALLADLDLAAPPPDLSQLPYWFQRSRRGAAGWQIAWTAWRDRVLGGKSYQHVMALLPLSAQQPADQPAIFARALELAERTSDRIALARIALAYQQDAFAERVITPLLATHGTRELYQLDAALALKQGRAVRALTDLEAAQSMGSDQPVGLGTARAELAQIINVARQVAIASSGGARDAAVAKALGWGARWRRFDPGNPQIDQQLGELLMAVGQPEEAWRQLSTVIERDPMSGSGYQIVAESFERQGKVSEALPFWQQAIVIDQTNPTPRLRKAQALIALGRSEEGDALLTEITKRKWHEVWSNVVYQAQSLLQQGRQQPGAQR